MIGRDAQDRHSIGGSSPSVTPGPGAPDPSKKLLAASAAAGGVIALGGYFLVRRWVKARFGR